MTSRPLIDASRSKLVEQFWAIKAAASEAMLNAGGTITHHHALGRDRGVVQPAESA
jgi:alkyldihydroxyacetonephosphate synthase